MTLADEPAGDTAPRRHGRAADAVGRVLRQAATRVPELVEPGGRLVVAFSGGQDSTCLLHALASQRRGPELIAAHVDHALRAESAETAARVAALATRFGVATIVRRVDVPAYRQRLRGWSVQQAARAARYHALADIVHEQRASTLVVAHTADDQAETLLLHLLRGSGLAGLGGMRLLDVLDAARLGPPPGEQRPSQAAPGARSVLRVARPLLRIRRTTTLAYCAELGLPFVEDASNQSRAYTRNRVRLDLLPALERFNPDVRGVLARTADLLAEDEAALEVVVESLHGQLARAVDADTLEYARQAWQAQPRGLRRRLLRHGLQVLLGGLVDVPASPIDDALDLVASDQAGQAYHLPYGVELRTWRTTFELRRHGAAQSRSRSKIWGPAGSGV